jgi:hypothetical protein
MDNGERLRTFVDEQTIRDQLSGVDLSPSEVDEAIIAIQIYRAQTVVDGITNELASRRASVTQARNTHMAQAALCENEIEHIDAALGYEKDAVSLEADGENPAVATLAQRFSERLASKGNDERWLEKYAPGPFVLEIPYVEVASSAENGHFAIWQWIDEHKTELETIFRGNFTQFSKLNDIGRQLVYTRRIERLVAEGYISNFTEATDETDKIIKGVIQVNNPVKFFEWVSSITYVGRKSTIAFMSVVELQQLVHDQQ